MINKFEFTLCKNSLKTPSQEMDTKLNNNTTLVQQHQKHHDDDDDELYKIKLIKILKQCKMVKENNISNLSIQQIAEFSLGYIILCECGIGEILILPSMEKYFEKFDCRDCENGCLTIKCNNCIDKENYYCFDEKKKYHLSYPPVSCRKCDDDDKQPICSNCSFICKGCLDWFCKQHHLKQICPTCNAEFCDKQECEFSICIGCNQKICSYCKFVLCSELKIWIDLREYDICRFCFCIDVFKYYPEISEHKSCMEIINMLKKYLKIPINIIEMIAIFSNN